METFELYNGKKIPCMGYGIGVVKQYSRNKVLFLKDNLRPFLRSIKHFELDAKIYRDIKTTKILNEAYDVGYRCFDTARIYGVSEKKIGKTFKGRREGLYYISKVSDMDLYRSGSPNTVSGNLSVSLRNLQTDYLDLYLLHYPSGKWVEMYREMEMEYRKGRVKAIGVCNFTLEQLKYLVENFDIKPMVCQAECHPLYTRKVLRDFCKENDIRFMAHTPTGRMCEKIKNNSVLSELADKYEVSISQIIMRWHFQNGVIPISHSLVKKHMSENICVDTFLLTPAEIDKIDKQNENYILLNSKGIDNPNYIYND